LFDIVNLLVSRRFFFVRRRRTPKPFLRAKKVAGRSAKLLT